MSVKTAICYDECGTEVSIQVEGITRSLKNGGSVIGKNSAIGSLLSGGWSRSKTGPSLAKNPLISKG